MIEGFDISNNNSTENVKGYIAVHEPRFCFMKASEGKTYQDKKVDEFYNIITEHNIVPGFYHFARSYANTTEEEAENFLFVVKPYLEKGCLLALDYEEKSLTVSNWIKPFCERVEEEVSGKVIVYMQRSAVKKKLPQLNDNGLWVASWGDSIGALTKYIDYPIAFWQDGIQSGLDHDWFNGNMEQLKKYLCFSKKVEHPVYPEIKVKEVDYLNFICGKRAYIPVKQYVESPGWYTISTEGTYKHPMEVTDIYDAMTIHGDDLTILTIGDTGNGYYN